MARQGYLSLRLSNQERELYQELADRKGVTLADWIRSSLAIVAHLERVETEIEASKLKFQRDNITKEESNKSPSRWILD